MAQFEINFFSEKLKRKVSCMAIIPTDRPLMPIPGWPQPPSGPTKTLYLLHGYTGNHFDWLFNSSIAHFALKYGIAVIMPSGENHFYIDDNERSADYTQFLGEELIDFTRRTFQLSDKREDTFISGFSMGGYGAIRTGLMYPQVFGKILAFSAALIVKSIAGKTPDFKNHVADYYYFKSVFGNLDNILESDRNPEVLVKTLLDQDAFLPGIKLLCGTEDELLGDNRDFYNYLKVHKVNAKYEEYEGGHDWFFIERHLEDSLVWLLDK